MPAQAGAATAGAMIRAAREALGLDQAALAAMLKIPLRRIDALEQGRHDELQGATFERALAQAACRVLKIDSKPVLALLPREGANTLSDSARGHLRLVSFDRADIGLWSLAPADLADPRQVLDLLSRLADAL